jgi:hypothetical protein
MSCSFCVGHCIVCTSNYDFWLPFDIFKLYDFWLPFDIFKLYDFWLPFDIFKLYDFWLPFDIFKLFPNIIIDLQQVTDNLYHIRLYRVHQAIGKSRPFWYLTPIPYVY